MLQSQYITDHLDNEVCLEKFTNNNLNFIANVHAISDDFKISNAFNVSRRGELSQKITRSIDLLPYMYMYVANIQNSMILSGKTEVRTVILN